MTESNRHPRSTQPHRPGTASVPVLFSLRNVQPNIVGGIANAAKTPSATTSGQAEPSSGRTDSTPVSAPATPAVQTVSVPVAMPKTATANGNRSFNVVVGLLVIALCLLVIRNTQSSKNGANATVAAIPAASQTGSKAETNATTSPPPISNSALSNSPNATTKVDLFPPLPNLQPPVPQLSELKKPEDKPLELGSFGAPMEIPSTSFVGSLDLNSPSSSNNSKDPISLRSDLTGATADSGASPEQNVVQAKPSLLLPSTKPETPLSASPSSSFPDPRLAMNPAAGNANLPLTNQINSSEASGSSSPTRTSEPSGSIMETGSELTTRELIDLRNRGIQPPPANSFNGQAYPKFSTEPTVPASTISNVTSVGTRNALPNGSMPYQPIPSSNTPSAYQPLPADNTMLSGRAYPPLPQENPAVKVPPYEQSALNAAQPSQMIRQPAANSSNRYPTTTTQVPYMPIAPTQGGNPFGYPPGK